VSVIVSPAVPRQDGPVVTLDERAAQADTFSKVVGVREGHEPLGDGPDIAVAPRRGSVQCGSGSPSILERKVLTPPDAVSLDELAARILAFQSSYEILAQPFEWKLTRADLARLLERLEQKTSGRLREAASIHHRISVLHH